MVTIRGAHSGEFLMKADIGICQSHVVDCLILNHPLRVGDENLLFLTESSHRLNLKIERVK